MSQTDNKILEPATAPAHIEEQVDTSDIRRRNILQREAKRLSHHSSPFAGR